MTEQGGQLLIWLLGTVLPVAGLYITLKTKTKEAEHRQTVLEMTVKYLSEKVSQNSLRLDHHEEQTKSLLILTEQMKSLTEDVKELKAMMKGKQVL